MNMKTVRKELQRAIGALVVPRGYKLTKIDKHTEGFVRDGDGIRQAIVIPLWDYMPEFKFSLTLCIRVEAVETVFHLFSETPPEYEASSETCLANLNAFDPNLDRISVYDTSTIEQAVTQLAPYVTGQILPFLDEHRDVRSLDRLVNQGLPAEQICGISGRGSWILSFVMHAVILARLAGNPQFDQLVERYRNEILVFPEPDQQKYERLVAHLRSLP